MVEFLREFENRGIKISRVNSILLYFNFERCLGPLWSLVIFRAQSINREVYDY